MRNESEITMLTDLVKSACTEWKKNGRSLDSTDFPRHVAKVIDASNAFGPDDEMNLRMVHQSIERYVQSAINNRKMGVPLSQQIAREIRDAGLTLQPLPILKNLRLTPLGADGSPDPSKPVVNMSGPVDVHFDVARGVAPKNIGTPRMSHRMAQLLFGVKKPEYPHRQARRVMEEILPAVMKRYFEKAGDYDENAQALGYRGQFADIWRKVGKLKRAWWDGKELRTEQPAEICEDLVAQLLLALLFVKDEGGAEIYDEEWDQD